VRERPRLGSGRKRTGDIRAGSDLARAAMMSSCRGQQGCSRLVQQHTQPSEANHAECRLNSPMPHNLAENQPVVSQGLGTYNISLNLTTISNSLFSFSSKIFNKIRGLDGIESHTVPSVSSLDSTVWTSAKFASPTPPAITRPIPNGIPGPWGFMTSGYVLALLGMVRTSLYASYTIL
jgi:hypothetical protein